MYLCTHACPLSTFVIAWNFFANFFMMKLCVQGRKSNKCKGDLDNIVTGDTSLMMSGGTLYINLLNLNKFLSHFQQILMKLNFLVVVSRSLDSAKFVSSKY